MQSDNVVTPSGKGVVMLKEVKSQNLVVIYALGWLASYKKQLNFGRALLLVVLGNLGMICIVGSRGLLHMMS